MYLEFFGLREFPFSLAPDPRYLYLSLQHREALAHLLYGVRSEGGFVQLTGEVGTGKTTVCRCFLEQLAPGTKAAVIFNPRLAAAELLAAVCDEFEIRSTPGPARAKTFLDRINEFLLAEHAQGHNAVLVVDEAQNLDIDVLEQLRLLTNLETSRRKLLQIILMGQPQLRATLARPELAQLAQRITARFHLGPLSREETAAYVRHRLEVAGTAEPLFADDVLRLLWRLSGGVPRMINVLCDRALLGAFVQGLRQVNRATLRQAEREVAGEGARPRLFHRLSPLRVPVVAAVSVLFLATLLTGGYRLLLRQPLSPPGGGPVAAAAPAIPPPPVVVPAPAAQPAPPPTAPSPVVQPLAVPQTAKIAEAAKTRSPRTESGEPEDQLHLLLAQPEATGETAVNGVLFALWGQSYKHEQGTICAQAQARGLSCLRGQGGLHLLRLLNRPAVLAFFDEEGRERRLALTGLEDSGRVTLAAGEKTAAIDLRWYGAYTLLWRAPPETGGVIAPGTTGPAVTWLSTRLARALGKGESGETRQIYDEGMAELVREFQRTVGLPEDGVAGPQTLLLLDREPGPGTPTLRRAAR